MDGSRTAPGPGSGPGLASGPGRGRGPAPGLGAALRCELLKARRSRLPPLVAAGFSLAPVMAGLFMVIVADPEQARRWGLITTKAQLFTETADWATFLGVVAQAVAVGGMLLFALVTAWVFGREFADRTVKIVLAVPTARWATVTAKMLVAGLISGLLAVWVFLLALVIGALIGLPGGTPEVLVTGASTAAVAAVLTIALLPPVAFFASAGRGYMAPLGFALLTLFLAQILAATGWGAWFPWSVAPLRAGIAGADSAAPGTAGYVLVAAASLAGFAATLAWWRRADNTT